MFRGLGAALLCTAVSIALVTTTAAQETALQKKAADLRERMNKGTVGVISGGVDGTYVRIAGDLASVLDDEKDIRVLPMIGKGSIQNIRDILYLRGIDVGIVQSDVLAHLKRKRLHAAIETRIHYITKLYNEEFHLLAGPGISSATATMRTLKGWRTTAESMRTYRPVAPLMSLRSPCSPAASAARTSGLVLPARPT